MEKQSRSDDSGRENGLLSKEEQAACETVSAAGIHPHSQRAKALLALNSGATQKAAAETAGLTVGQLTYWLSRFREIKISIFPEALRVGDEAEGAGNPQGEAAPLSIPEPAPSQEETSGAEADPPVKAEKSGPEKGKKAKSSKKKKKKAGKKAKGAKKKKKAGKGASGGKKKKRKKKKKKS